MKRNRSLWLIGIGVLLLMVIAYLLNTDRHDWRESYDPKVEEPYGTFFLSNLLQNYFPGEDYHVLEDSFDLSLPLSAGDSARANYVFVGAGMYLRPSDVQRLLNFVGNGNQAIIATRVLPFDLMFELYFEECDSLWWDGLSSVSDTLAAVDFKHENLKQKARTKYSFYDKNKAVSYEWRYIEDYYFCDLEEGLVPLGTMNDGLVNFAQRPYGEGNFYLHTMPLAFTNYHLLEEDKLQYVDNVFSHLQEGPIYWDEYSGVSERVGEAINNRDYNSSSRMLRADSPLQFILSKPALSWAWYLLLVAALLYVAFLSRRKQRVIPVLQKNTNTSLEFLSTIGHLYFLQNNHKQLALQKMQLFRSFIREKYHLHGLEFDEEFKKRLQQKSDVDRPLIDKIFLIHSNIKKRPITENTLIDFHKAMEQFYRHCK